MDQDDLQLDLLKKLRKFESVTHRAIERQIKGNSDFGSLAKRSSARSFGLLAASAIDEESQEYPQDGQGLFTFALAKAFGGAADFNQDSAIEVHEIHRFAKDFVERNRPIPTRIQPPPAARAQSD